VPKHRHNINHDSGGNEASYEMRETYLVLLSGEMRYEAAARQMLILAAGSVANVS